VNINALLLGLLWGGAVGIGNYYYLQWVIKKNEGNSPEQEVLAIAKTYIIRFFVNVFALFLVYRNTWMLVGTALGLTVFKNIIVIRGYIDSKKRSQKTRKKLP